MAYSACAHINEEEKRIKDDPPFWRVQYPRMPSYEFFMLTNASTMRSYAGFGKRLSGSNP